MEREGLARANYWKMVKEGSQKLRYASFSNPRYSFPHTRFPGEHLQPLGHLSAYLSHKRDTKYNVNIKITINIGRPTSTRRSARRTANYGKTRLPKLVMPSFCEQSEAKAVKLPFTGGY